MAGFFKARLSGDYWAEKLTLLARHGWRGFAGYHADQLLRLAGVHIFAIFVADAAAATAVDDAGSHFEIRVIAHKDLVRHAINPELDLSPDFVDGAIRRGDICIGALSGEKLVSYTWHSENPVPAEKGLWVSPDWPTFYRYKTFTLPAYRGLRIPLLLHAAGDRQAIARRHAEIISYVRINNFASIRSTMRSGGQRVGYAGYLAIPGHPLPFRTAGAAQHGFQFTAGDGEHYLETADQS
jgi:hypothetical protein